MVPSCSAQRTSLWCRNHRSTENFVTNIAPEKNQFGLRLKWHPNLNPLKGTVPTEVLLLRLCANNVFNKSITSSPYWGKTVRKKLWWQTEQRKCIKMLGHLKRKYIPRLRNWEGNNFKIQKIMTIERGLWNAAYRHELFLEKVQWMSSHPNTGGCWPFQFCPQNQNMSW